MSRTAFDQVLDEANLGEDRIYVALLANHIKNTTPGYRPSDAARHAVRLYRRDPEKVRNRKSGEWLR